MVSDVYNVFNVNILNGTAREADQLIRAVFNSVGITVTLLKSNCITVAEVVCSSTI